MIISDSFHFFSVLLLFISSSVFSYRLFKNRKNHCSKSIEYSHWKEHGTIALLCFVGSFFGVVFDGMHLIAQNYISFIDLDLLEILQNCSDTFLYISFTVFILHVRKEEDPHHCFYYLTLPMGTRNDTDL